MAYRICSALALTAVVAGLLVSCASSGARHRGPATGTTSAVSDIEKNVPEIKTGMTKAEVRSAWGEPRDQKSDSAAPGTEVWIYERVQGRATEGGAAARAVVQRTQYFLTFEGDRLTKIEKKEL